MLTFVVICFLVLLTASGATPATGLMWDFANAIGFCGVAALIYLAWDSETPAKTPKVRLHANFSLLAALLVGGHVVILLGTDEVVIEYLKLKAPFYMLAGIVAVVLIAFLTITSFPKMRRRTFRKFPLFRKMHLVLSTIVVGLTVWHVAGSGYYLDTLYRQTGFVAITIGAPLFAVIYRHKLGNPPTNSTIASVRQADSSTYWAFSIALVLSSLYTLMKNL